MKNSRYIIFNQNETKGQIEAAQSDMTQVEHTIANYFLNNEELTDFSSKRISALLYVSEATLSRFAKKCGFKGYREFIFAYEKDLKEEKNGQSVRKISVCLPRRYRAVIRSCCRKILNCLMRTRSAGLPDC